MNTFAQASVPRAYTRETRSDTSLNNMLPFQIFLDSADCVNRSNKNHTLEWSLKRLPRRIVLDTDAVLKLDSILNTWTTVPANDYVRIRLLTPTPYNGVLSSDPNPAGVLGFISQNTGNRQFTSLAGNHQYAGVLLKKGTEIDSIIIQIEELSNGGSANSTNGTGDFFLSSMIRTHLSLCLCPVVL